MEEEMEKKGNCITQYNTLREKEHTNVINKPCKSKKEGLGSFVESCVCHLVCTGVSFEQTHAV